MLAFAAALMQTIWIPAPADDVPAFLTLWLGVAAISICLVAAETVTRSRRLHSRLADSMVASAIDQLLPAAFAGAAVTFAIMRFAPTHVPLLPALWQIVFGLGICAASRSLPRASLGAGAWYILCGAIGVVLWQGEQALSPWSMGGPFGIGQILTACLIHRALEADRVDV